MLDKIDTLRPRLRKSERRVADYILAHPNTSIRSSLTVLADTVGVSQPTVIRFCRAIGCEGFQDFKLNLAQSLATGARYFHRGVDKAEPTDDYSRAFEQMLLQLAFIRRNLDISALNQATALLSKAKRIECYACFSAVGPLRLVHERLLRCDLCAIMHTDVRTQQLTASVLGRSDVVLAMMIATQCDELLHSVVNAQRSGAKIISMISADSPLRPYSDVCLMIDKPQSSATDVSFGYLAMGYALEEALNRERQRNTV